MAVPSQAPMRLPNGVSTDSPFGPLANFGMPHPFNYNAFADDFQILHAQYTQTHTGNGTIASTPGDGGRLLFTTNSSTPLVTDIASIQMAAACYTYTAGKKMFFLASLQVSDVVNAAFMCGLIQTTATPFTVADGIYFSKPTGGAANLVLNCVVGSANVGQIVIPTAAYALANNVDIDLGFSIDRNGYVQAFVGANLINVAASNAPAGQVKGPVGVVLPTSFTAVVLNPTLAIQSGTASSKTMNADFMLAAKER